MVTNNAIQKIAKLAKLKFADEDVNNIQNDINNIMNMINSLNELDCSNVEPLTSVSDMTQRMRKDEVTTFDISDDIFANINQKNAQLSKEIKCFIVPKVVE